MKPFRLLFVLALAGCEGNCRCNMHQDPGGGGIAVPGSTLDCPAGTVPELVSASDNFAAYICVASNDAGTEVSR